MKEFLALENKMLSDPKTFFPTIEGGIKWRTAVIWKEYIEWQNNGGKLQDMNFEENMFDKDILQWNIGNDYYAIKEDFTRAPFSKEQFKKGISAVYSFMNDRPQYYRFRDREGMFNPLSLLLYKFL